MNTICFWFSNQDIEIISVSSRSHSGFLFLPQFSRWNPVPGGTLSQAQPAPSSWVRLPSRGLSLCIFGSDHEARPSSSLLHTWPALCLIPAPSLDPGPSSAADSRTWSMVFCSVWCSLSCDDVLFTFGC